MAESQEPVTYHGNCHCGRYRFELSVPQIQTAISCTCSLCRKKGPFWLVPPEGAFRVVRDDGYLTEYQSPALRDRFCNYCGTQVTGKHLNGPLAGQFAVNVRTIRYPYVNPFKLEPDILTVNTQDGKREIDRITEDSSQTPPSQHIFACHCGKVQVELLVPIEEQELKEDNCSGCVRAACIGVYPTKDQVRIHGREHGFEYLSGRKFAGSVACRTCGVSIFSNIYGPPISVFDKLPPERKEIVLAIYHKNMEMVPLNVRAMEGVDLDSLQINRTDEGTEGYELDP